jgi:hypothetical protein
MAVDITDIVVAGVGFLIAALMIPMCMSMAVSTSVIGWNPAVVTLFQVLLPILYLIGTALVFIPKMGSGKKE